MTLAAQRSWQTIFSQSLVFLLQKQGVRGLLQAPWYMGKHVVAGEALRAAVGGVSKMQADMQPPWEWRLKWRSGGAERALTGPVRAWRRPDVLMQKEKNPENATKLLSNLVGVAGAHIDALDEHGYTDHFQNFKQPQILTDVLNYTQARRTLTACTHELDCLGCSMAMHAWMPHGPAAAEEQER